MPWTQPSLTLKWGPYQRPDPQEQQAISQAVQAALGANKGVPVITKKMALQKLKASGVIDIENVDAVTEELEQEAKAADERELEKAKGAMELQQKAAPESGATGQQGPGQRRRSFKPPDVTRQPNRGRG